MQPNTPDFIQTVTDLLDQQVSAAMLPKSSIQAIRAEVDGDIQALRNLASENGAAIQASTQESHDVRLIAKLINNKISALIKGHTYFHMRGAELVADYSSDSPSPKQKAYQDFFMQKLEDFGVNSPAELDDAQKRQFFNEIELEWTGDTQ